MTEQGDVAALRHWARVAAERLEAAREVIDRVNVFPVRDSDTGTNLALTARAAADSLPEGGGHDPEPPTLGAAARALARGALLGARGNSGVILAQVLLGAAEVLEADDAGEAGPQRLRAALRHGAEQAWAAVSRPVEGTVLSVLSAAAQAADAAPPGAGCAEVATSAAAGAADALAATTLQLPVLTEAGVVDAGGLGMLLVLDALTEALGGPAAPDRLADLALPPGLPRPPLRAHPGACDHEVMYLLQAPDDAAAELRQALEPLGDSLLVVGGGGLFSVHVHVPVVAVGPALEAGLVAGRPSRIRVEQLDVSVAEPERSGRAVVAVAPGGELADLFAAEGAVVLPCTPGDPPAAEALLAAVEDTRATEVLLLPNAVDVLPAARRAAELARERGVTASVVATRAPVQALAALAVHDDDARLGDDVAAMSTAAAGMRHGEVGLAEERALTSAGICEPGDVLGLVDGDVAVIGDDVVVVAAAVLDRLLIGGGELVTLVGPPDQRTRAELLRDYLQATRPSTETSLLEGSVGARLLLVGVE